jgi:hypothetical protein
VSDHDERERSMARGYQRAVHPGGAEIEKGTTEQHAAADSDGTCRCKETSKMTPQELLKLMFSDLAFWKKTKKG